MESLLLIRINTPNRKCMTAIFHQFTPTELYIGIVQPANITDQNQPEPPTLGFHPTGCGFLDAFVANVHNHGVHTTAYHAHLMGVSKTELCFTVLTLTGMSFTDFTDAYILLLAKDLMEDKKNDLKFVAQRLGFGSYSGFYRFIIRKKKEKPSWLK